MKALPIPAGSACAICSRPSFPLGFGLLALQGLAETLRSLLILCGTLPPDATTTVEEIT